MADLHIVRTHSLGLAKARRIALEWAEEVEQKFDMECIYEKGHGADLVRFSRAGVHGELHVAPDRFELDAKLGFLLGTFKGRIESEITKSLDAHLPPVTHAKAQAAKKSTAGRK